MVDYSAVVMDEGGIKCWFFFIFFVWGYYDKIFEDKWNTSIGRCVALPLFIVAFFAYKKLAPHSDGLLLLQILFIPFLLGCVIWGAKGVAKWIYMMKLPKTIQKALILLSNLTLEIYVVQIYLIHWLMPQMIFPVNVVVILIIILLAAIVCKYLSEKISGFILRYL